MKYANSAARLVRRAMLTKDEDGEKVHRFQHEWDGSDGNIRWARYDADHDQSIWTARTWTSWGPIQCPECAAAVGEPCQAESWPVLTVCTPRKLSVAFGEGQQWPPRRNQIGSKQMREWLADHVTVLTGEA